MRKLAIVSVLFFLMSVFAFAKNSRQISGNKSFFLIDGRINADTGCVHLYNYNEYISAKKSDCVVRVKNGRFSISGTISEPQAVFLMYNDSYLSSDFVIDKGTQSIVIHTDSSRKVPVIDNKIMKTEYPVYTKFFSKYELKYAAYIRKYDSLYKINNYKFSKDIKLNKAKEDDMLYAESNQLLLSYVRSHPNSPIALWKVIQKMTFGYEPVFDSIFNVFGRSQKESYAGRILQKKLRSASLLSEGKQFPAIQCFDSLGLMFSPSIFGRNKFTLVDFWYSRCGPCLRQFEILKQIYFQYKASGFEIIGISVDKTADRNSWLKTISNEKLIWNHYLDLNGNEAHRFSIHAFPFNFLVNDKGVIVAKNISMEALEQLLTEKLN